VYEVRKLEVDIFVPAAEHIPDVVLDRLLVRMAAVVEVEVEVEADSIEHCPSAWVLWGRTVTGLPTIVSYLKSKLIHSKLINH